MRRKGLRTFIGLAALSLALFPAGRAGASDAPGTSTAAVRPPETASPPAPPQIRLVYPREGSRLPSVGRSFVFGSVQPATASVTINGSSVSVYRTGSFIAYIPFSPGNFKIRAVASSGGANAEAVRAVSVDYPPPPSILPAEPAVIETDSVQPSTTVALAPGDPLPLRFHGSVRGRARYRIRVLKPSHVVGDWKPMREVSPGRYEAERYARPQDRMDLAQVEYRLTSPRGRAARAKSAGRLVVAQREVAAVVEVSTDEAILRTGPAIGFNTMGYDLFLANGVRLEASGAVGGEVRVRLSDTLSAWTDRSALRVLPAGTPLPRAILDSVRTQSLPRGAAALLDLDEKVPYRVSVSDDLRTLTLTLFYAVSNVDRMRYDEDSKRPLFGEIRWSQPADGTVELKFRLNRRLWGYEVRYDGDRLVCEVYSPPAVQRMRPLSGLTVAVDPGHSPEPTDGTIGPQGIKESEVVYRIAMVLKDRLQRAGAKVFVTRGPDEVVSLQDRGRRAHQAGADLFVSLHANALPDGADPFERGGYSVFYFQPQSYELGRAVHAAYAEEIPLSDDGFYYGNLAVCRPTDMPSILTESGYLILPQEEEKLLDPAFQRRIADAIVHGLSAFLRPFSGG